MKVEFKVIMPLLLITAFIQQAAGTPKIQVYLKEACGYSGMVQKNYVCEDDISNSLEKLIANMITFSGFKGDRINIFNSEIVDMPITGVDTLGYVTIIVNEKIIGKKPSWYIMSILAHELGHVYRRHLYDVDCVTKPHELQADYYAGFFAHRAGCPLLDSVMAPYRNVIMDDDHPDPKIRCDSVLAGWHDAVLPFKLNLNDSASFASQTNDADRFRKYADLFVTVTPYHKFLHSDVVYKVTFHLTLKNPDVPLDSLISHIDLVSYLLDRDSFETPLIASTNPNYDNYGYRLTGIWGEFPIKCVIYFKDDSILPIVKQFTLPKKKS